MGKENVSGAFDPTLTLSEAMGAAVLQLLANEDAWIVNERDSAYPYVAWEGQAWTMYDMKNSEFWLLVERGWLVPMLNYRTAADIHYTLSFEARETLLKMQKLFGGELS